MGADSPHQAPPLTGARPFFQALLGSWFFTGYFPVAPATFTSFWTLPLAFLAARLPLVHAAGIVGLFFIGVAVAGALERRWGPDPGRVTIDEVVGTLVTFFLLPLSPWGMALGFLVWRFFDIVKLPFINRSQRLPGGWGIMVDDLLAGIVANLALRLLLLVTGLVLPGVHSFLVR